MSDLSVAYYGYVFDSSGYGHAARGYVRALHAAGVDVNVVELARRARQVPDPLLESLVRRRTGADLHLFHGIPPEWARLAFRLRNAIGMTVWETDVMPTQWRGALTHVRELWLPCDHNVEVFRASLITSVFKLPHVLYESVAGDATVALPLTIAPSDFVVYAVFEWQDRKHPHGMLEAFLRAFPRDDDALLVLKTNPGAATVARQALTEARASTGSRGRVSLHAEAWTPAELAALRARGDCYLSLHRGEGWGYPLFEAAARGTPVVATGFSGPMEYLRDDEHSLVRSCLVPVHQPYVYYNPRMRWAEPDVEHAAALLRDVRADPTGARSRAARGAQRIRATYDVHAVGAMARERLVELHERLAHRRHAGLTVVDGAGQAKAAPARATPHALPTPPVPVPGDWYDADYFEHGIKSNWQHGYQWPRFSGLFRDTAGFLVELFPQARSFLDVGCAKGFLVRALHERGRECRGFDASPWAIQHAEPLARPWIMCADVLDFDFDRDYDLIVALDLFSHLTESQGEAFLRRARPFARLGILASIPSLGPAAAGERDATHVSRHAREWWRELFLASGWTQDPLHQTLEAVCRRHALPTRMGWELYLFSPGHLAKAAVVREATA